MAFSVIQVRMPEVDYLTVFYKETVTSQAAHNQNPVQPAKRHVPANAMNC